jgi:hypothetical protein
MITIVGDYRLLSESDRTAEETPCQRKQAEQKEERR